LSRQPLRDDFDSEFLPANLKKELLVSDILAKFRAFIFPGSCRSMDFIPAPAGIALFIRRCF
jgi:hypothetical protein